MTCNYRIKETKLFAVIYFSTNSTWQADALTIQNTDQQYSQTSSQKLKTFCPRVRDLFFAISVSFKKVNYAQHIQLTTSELFPRRNNTMQFREPVEQIFDLFLTL